jgi:hypothetical protein
MVDQETPDKLRLTESHMIPMLVNAIQELKREFDLYKVTHP